MSIHPHATTWLALGTWNFISDDFSKICQWNSSFIKIWQEYWLFHTKPYVHPR